MISHDSDAAVVLVEDPFICRYVRTVLSRRHLTVLEADAAQASTLVGTARTKVRLLITNHPDDFTTFAGDLPVLYVAAQPDEDLAGVFHHCRTLRKPFTPEELTGAVLDLIETVVS